MKEQRKKNSNARSYLMLIASFYLLAINWSQLVVAGQCKSVRCPINNPISEAQLRTYDCIIKKMPADVEKDQLRIAYTPPLAVIRINNERYCIGRDCLTFISLGRNNVNCLYVSAILPDAVYFSHLSNHVFTGGGLEIYFKSKIFQTQSFVIREDLIISRPVVKPMYNFPKIPRPKRKKCAGGPCLSLLKPYKKTR